MRQQFVVDVAEVEAERLVYVDESGFQTNMTRTHARSPRGERAYSRLPRNRGRNLTLLCGLTLAGPVAPLVVTGGVDGAVFETYVREVLCPELRPGHVVVVDNLGAHQRPEVARLIEQAGGLLVFLPPYSPDLNPIEQLFSKLKASMRALQARSRQAVINGLALTLRAVSSLDAQGWFRACRNPQLLW